MVDLLEVASSEATKIAATAVLGGVDKAAHRLFRLLRERLGSLPDRPDEIRQAVLTLARSDAAWAAELILSVAALNSGLAPAIAPRGIDCFRNHAWLLSHPPRAGVKLISGPPGSGRTELARQLADRVGDEFPAGRVELAMTRFRVGAESDLAAVKRYVLRRFGVPDKEIPLDDERLAEQFRSVLATRRFVVIVDDVTSEHEVRPFLEFPANLVLATTATLTRGLAALDRAPILLRGLDPDGAREMLADFCGHVRLEDEPGEVGRLLALCGGMPFALREVGLTLAARSGEPQPVAGLLAEYRASGVVDAENAIRDSLRRTFDGLSPEVTLACALLAEFPGHRFTRQTAIAYLGGLGASAATAFDAVVAAQLTEQDRGWHRLMPLVRQYAGGLAADREMAFGNLLRYMRDHTVAADLAGDRESGQVRLREYVVPSGLSWSLPENRFDWLEYHLGLIGELVRSAVWRGKHMQACQLAGAIEVLVNQRGHWREFAEISDWAVKAATALHGEQGDERAALLARAHAMRAKARYLARWFEPAEQDLVMAQQFAERARTPHRRKQRLTASVAEFWGRYYDERFDALGARERLTEAEREDRGRFLADAERWLRAAVAIDEKLGDSAALGIHLRMLALVLTKAGRAGDALAAARRAFDHTADRNRARVYMVLARVHLALADVAGARMCLTDGKAQLERLRADQYHWELREIEARVLAAEGDAEGARLAWANLGYDAFRIGHPRANEYFSEIGGLPPASGSRR